MATKKISELTAQADILTTDLLEIETAGGLSRYTTLAKVYADMVRNSVVAKTASYDILDNDGYSRIEVDTTLGDITIKLPANATNVNRPIEIANVKGGTNKVIITATDGAVLSNDALSAIWLPKIGDFVKFQYSATSGYWEIINEKITCSYWYDGHAGYGSSDTKIQKYANNPKAVGNMISSNHGSYGTKGLEITILRSGIYSVSYLNADAYYFGVTLNSTELTINIQSMTVPTRKLSNTTIQTAGYLGNASVPPIYLSKNDIFRPHGTTTSTPSTPDAIFRIEYVGN